MDAPNFEEASDNEAAPNMNHALKALEDAMSEETYAQDSRAAGIWDVSVPGATDYYAASRGYLAAAQAFKARVEAAGEGIDVKLMQSLGTTAQSGDDVRKIVEGLAKAYADEIDRAKMDLWDARERLNNAWPKFSENLEKAAAEAAFIRKLDSFSTDAMNAAKEAFEANVDVEKVSDAIGNVVQAAENFSVAASDWLDQTTSSVDSFFNSLNLW